MVPQELTVQGAGPAEACPPRMLRVEVHGMLHDWFDVERMGDFVRSASFSRTLRQNVARYFEIPEERQAIFDDDGLLATAVDFVRAVSRVAPKLYVYDMQAMQAHLRARTAEELRAIGEELGQFWQHFGACGGLAAPAGTAPVPAHMPAGARRDDSAAPPLQSGAIARVLPAAGLAPFPLRRQEESIATLPPSCSSFSACGTPWMQAPEGPTSFPAEGFPAEGRGGGAGAPAAAPADAWGRRASAASQGTATTVAELQVRPVAAAGLVPGPCAAGSASAAPAAAGGAVRRMVSPVRSASVPPGLLASAAPQAVAVAVASGPSGVPGAPAALPAGAAVRFVTPMRPRQGGTSAAAGPAPAEQGAAMARAEPWAPRVVCRPASGVATPCVPLAPPVPTAPRLAAGRAVSPSLAVPAAALGAAGGGLPARVGAAARSISPVPFRRAATAQLPPAGVPGGAAVIRTGRPSHPAVDVAQAPCAAAARLAAPRCAWRAATPRRGSAPPAAAEAGAAAAPSARQPQLPPPTPGLDWSFAGATGNETTVLLPDAPQLYAS